MEQLVANSETGQLGVELELMQSFIRLLNNPTAIHAGSARGTFPAVCAGAGCEQVHIFEPDTERLDYLQARFRNEPRVHIHGHALGSEDGEATISTAADHRRRSPNPLAEFGVHTPSRRPKTASVRVRTLGSLVDDGTIPRQVGLLKINPDLSVLDGLGALECEVVAVPFWHSYDRRFGECPYTLRQLTEAIAQMQLSNFVVFARRDEFQLALVNDTASRPGDWGTVFFIHDDRAQDLGALFFEAAARVQNELAGRAQHYLDEAKRRMEIVASAESQLRAAHTLHRIISLIPRPFRRLGRAAIFSTPRDAASSRLRFEPRLHLVQHESRPLKVPDKYRESSLPSVTPTISIVTPSYNQEQFIETAIESVVDQRYPRIEYVVQDGGSTDGTTAILEQRARQLHHWDSRPDAGQASAINAGFKQTSGEIMGYLNSDDFLLPGSLAYVARYFANHPKVDVIYSHRVIVDEDGMEVGRWLLPRHDSRTLTWADYVPQETLFWRRWVWERTGSQINEDLDFAIDWDLLLRFHRAGARFARVPRFLAAFRVHDASKTAAKLEEEGRREMRHIRESWHSRPIADDEVSRSLKGFFLRHMFYDRLYRSRLRRY